MGTSGLILFQMSIDGPHDDHSTKANTHNNNATQATAYWVRGTQFNTIESACTRSPRAPRQKSGDRERHIFRKRLYRQAAKSSQSEKIPSVVARHFYNESHMIWQNIFVRSNDKRPSRRCRDQFALTTSTTTTTTKTKMRRKKMANVKRNAMRTMVCGENNSHRIVA